MGPDEKDRKRSDEADVEAHARHRRTEDEGVKAPEDKAPDNEPDVEAHRHTAKP